MKTIACLLIAIQLYAFDSFNYFSVGGGASNRYDYAFVPSLSYGHRFLFGRHCCDIQAGAQVSNHYQGLYGQCAYLNFPFPPEHLYLGTGLRSGVGHHERHVKPFYSIPLLLGFQFQTAAGKRHFIQSDVNLPYFKYTYQFPMPLVAIHYGFEY